MMVYLLPKHLIIFRHLSSSSLQLPHATVSCVECVSATLLFDKVLLSFFGSDAASLLPRSPSLSDFVRIFRQHSSQFPAKQTRYIVSSLLLSPSKDVIPHLQNIHVHGASRCLCYVSFCLSDNVISCEANAKQSSRCSTLKK